MTEEQLCLQKKLVEKEVSKYFLAKRKMLLSRIRQVVFDDDDAEDVLQDTLLAVIIALSKKEDLDLTKENIGGYMNIACKNCAINWLRKNSKERHIPLEHYLESGEIAEEPAESLQRSLRKFQQSEAMSFDDSQLKRWDKLSDFEKRLAQMYAEDYSHKEIAEALNITVANVKSRVVRIKDKMSPTGKRELKFQMPKKNKCHSNESQQALK